MEYRNETERKITEQLMSSVHVWDNLSKKLPLKIELVLTESKTGYAIYNDGHHTGSFLPACFVDPAEVKAIKWKIIGPSHLDVEVKHNKKRK